MNDEAKDYFNQAVNTAYSQGYSIGYDKGYNEGYEQAWNDYISRSDKRKHDEQDNIPLEELRAEIGGLEDCISELEGRVKRVEAVVFYGGKEKT